jgi:hypothetical protein
VHLKDKESRGVLLGLFLRDPISEVRRVAAFGIASISLESTRKEDVRALLERFLDEWEAIAVRGAAYEAMVLIYHRRDFPPVMREIDVHRDVDWPWIDSLRRAVM